MKAFNLVLALASLGAVASCGKSPTTQKFVFAQDFKGAAAVIYGVPGAPALPVVDGVRVVEIPSDGVLQTSSPQEYGRQEGSAMDKYFQHHGAELKPLNEKSGTEEVYGGDTGTIGSCASVRWQYVGDGVKAKVGEMRKALDAKLLGSVCKPK